MTGASDFTSPQPPTPLTPSDERTWAMLAHLSVLLNLVTAVLGTVAALVIYLVFKDRSKYVAYQAMQSFVMQLIFWVGGGLLVAVSWFLSSLLVAVFIGILCIPFACILSFLPLAGVVYGIVGGVQCSQGQDFKYWLVGDWVRTILHQ
jgi:uncharacterized Tic20 family protein